MCTSHPPGWRTHQTTVTFCTEPVGCPAIRRAQSSERIEYSGVMPMPPATRSRCLQACTDRYTHDAFTGISVVSVPALVEVEGSTVGTVHAEGNILWGTSAIVST